MNARNFLSLLLLTCVAPLLSQDFVTLNWRNNKLQNSLPDFENAVKHENSKLPHYTQTFDLGTDFELFNYEVKIEYPEYEELNGKETLFITKSFEKLEDYPQVKTSVGISAKKGLLEASFIPIVYKNNKYFKIRSFKLSLSSTLKKNCLSKKVSSQYTYNSVLSKGKWIKIRVAKEGVYKITDRELLNMGFSNPSNVRLYGYGGRILAEKVESPTIDDLQEIPFWREDGYVLFFANGTISWTLTDNKSVEYKHCQNRYSNYSYYFLTESNGNPKAFAGKNSSPEDNVQLTTSFPDYTLYENDGFSWLPSGQTFFEEYDYKQNPKKSYMLHVPGIISKESVKFTVSFSANSKTETTTVNVNANGTNLGDISLKSVSGKYTFASIATSNFKWTSDKKEQINITLTHNRPSDVSGHLDFIRLNYLRSLNLSNSYLRFRGATGKLKFILSGTNAQTRIWDITDVNNYQLINGNHSGDNYTFTIENDQKNEYVAVNTTGDFEKVEVVGEVPNQNLHGITEVEMIIIVPPVKGLIEQAERLAQVHRQNDDMKVKIVTSEQIYNEFSSGTPDATAYRNFMKLLYDRSAFGENQLKYLLLFGDAIWDNRMITPAWRKYDPRNFLLCFESENSLDTSSSYVLEDYFGFLDDKEGSDFKTDKLDIGIGRIPARTVDEAKKVVDKTIDYIYNKNSGAWKNITCFLGDDEAKVTSHIEGAEYMAQDIEKNHPELLVNKIYWDAYDRVTSASGNSYPDAKKNVIEQMKNGALIMAYSGHASPDGLSHEFVLKTNDIKKTPSSKLPFWLTMGCDVGPFDSGKESFGKELILNPKGGAIGALASTRTTNVLDNEMLGGAFIKYALIKRDGKTTRVGDALREAKCSLYGVNKLQYVLLGDPAVSLNNYEYQIVVDEFNGNPAQVKSLIKAGSKVTVKGHIVDETGNPDDLFNGIIYSIIMDSMEKLTTQGHDGAKQYEFQARTKKLFTGADSIRSGKFCFTFPVPMDISYSYESGLLNFYGLNSCANKEAKGNYENFQVGGTEKDVINENLNGPKIYMYLNTPEFPNGGEVNATPLLIAELEDEDGINIVGNGIGHDLTATIDNSPVFHYVLNNYYVTDFGSYSKGVVRYSLPKLPEGKHQLELRAWDLKNNSAVSTLDFYVNNSLSPVIDINYIYSNGSQATFIISHNRPESPVDININVSDCSGKTVWTFNENIQSLNPAFYMDWNLTDNQGRKLQPGIYLYHVTISSNGSKESSQTKKMVIL